jgi:hypothetical protein
MKKKQNAPVNSSYLATYSRQNLTFIVVRMLIGVACPPKISQDARIYETLARTPKIIKKISFRLATRNKKKQNAPTNPSNLAIG